MNVMDFLNANVKPAMGCTEPVAVAYATAIAYHVLSGGVDFNDKGLVFKDGVKTPENERVKYISVHTDRDVFKNALAVSIPGTGGQKGMAIASAMGLYSNPADNLTLLARSTKEIARKATELVDGKKVGIEEVTDEGEKASLDIKVHLDYRTNGVGHVAYVNLTKEHDHVALVEVDGNVLYQNEFSSVKKGTEDFPGRLEEMLAIIKNLTPEERAKAYEGISMNLAIAKAGLTETYGLGLGKMFNNFLTDGTLNNDVITEVRIRAAAAGDARMGGAEMAVMSTAGSGNQGITALIPIAVVGEYYQIDRDRISEAALLSHLVTKYAALKSGHLSALCGCNIKAGMGAAAGVAYLLGGEVEQINDAINIMAANTTGVICDGAKDGCALKLSTAAGSAAESGIMAVRGMKVRDDNGIIFDDAMETIVGVGEISEAMIPTDKTVVKLMHQKLIEGGN